MRDIKLCVPALQTAWQYAQLEWQKRNPNKPQVFLTCTLRTKEEQTALYAQGRKPLTEINKLRKIAKLNPIKQDEAKNIITHAQAGQSKHNPNPAGMSLAFDIGFIGVGSGKNQKLYWDTPLFKEFAEIIKSKYPVIIWGGDWKKFKDYPHFEI